jgi:putative hydroxymethylpyrimidine transport system substrate-binding protein
MRGICVVLAVAGALVVAGCGGGDGGESSQAQEEFRPLRNVTVTLDGHEGPENVGILMAKERGYFTDARLSVSVLTPIVPARPVQYVVTRQDDFGVAQEPQLVVAKAKGAPVIAVGSLLHEATASMIWLPKPHLDSIAAMKGKTIAIPGVPFQKDFLASLLSLYRLKLSDVKVINVGYDLVPALVSGRADAIFGGAWNVEGEALKSRGLNPIVIPPKSLGFPPFNELMVIARTDLVEKRPGLVRDFMSAVARGTAAAIEDPHAAAKAIEEAGLGGKVPGRKTLEAQLASTLPMLSKSGYMYSQESIRLVDWMHEEGMIKKFPTPAELLNDEFASWHP